MMRSPRLLARLRRDEQGTAAIELGLAIPIVFMLLLGLIDIARGYSIKLQLEQVAQRSIEKVMNGQADRATIAALRTEAAAAAEVPESSVTTTAWLECSGGTGAPTFFYHPNDDDQMCPTAQPIFRRYLSVRIVKSFSPIFHFRWLGANADGSYTIVGATSVRTQ